MADISDVEQTVVDVVTAILYPGGATQSSIIGTLCRIYRGWPNSATLNTDLSAGAVNVSIGADNDSGRLTTRYLPKWETVPDQAGTAATVADQSVTIGGNPNFGDVVGVIVDGQAYAYRIRAGDSPDLVASNLQSVIQSVRLSSVQGSTISIPGAASIMARVVCDNVASYESRRQEKNIRIICWCPGPIVRDSITAAIDAAINQMDFLSLPDSTLARIVYHNTASYDQAQNALLYRRDLIYTVEYATISTFEQPSMLFGASGLNANVTYG